MATVLDNSYENLKLIAIEKYNSRHRVIDINFLKEVFSSKINSHRTLSQISDIASLIVILEKRAVLSPVDIDAFELIFNALQLSSVFLDKHNDLIKINNDCLFIRQYEDEMVIHDASYNLSGFRPTINNLNCNNSESSSLINNGILSDRVLNVVCSQIGRSWKSLARYLKVIKESTIDKIEEDQRINSNVIRARMILAEFQQKEEPSELRPRLLKALRLSGRMDIHDQIETIMFNEF